MSEKTEFKAFDDGGSDELLRKSLEGFRVEPGPGLWKGISRKLLWSELIRFNFTNLSPKLWISGAVGVMLIATVLYIGSNGASNSKSSPHASPVADRDIQSGSKTTSGAVLTPVNTTSAVNSMKEVVAKPPVEIAATTSSPVLPVNAATGYKKGPSARPSNTLAGTAIFAHAADPFITAGETAMEMTEAPAVSEIAGLPGITPVTPLEGYVTAMYCESDSIITITNAAGVLKFTTEQPGAGRFFSANLGITPEVAFYQQPEAYSNINVWLNGGITWHVSRFSVATGLGLGYVYDEGKYKVDYKSKDSIGYYYGVTSYTIGSDNEIIFNTQTVKVYDSLQHSSDYRTKNRYSYLQVPLLFGYRFFESGRVSLTFEAGPAMSLLLGSRLADPVIEYSNATIIRTDDHTPERVAVNWQIWSNLYFEMRMNKQLSIYLEPSFKYYLKSITEQENVKFKAPWTIGLGVGIQFNFGQKTTKP